jgi:hypothetical protein
MDHQPTVPWPVRPLPPDDPAAPSDDSVVLPEAGAADHDAPATDHLSANTSEMDATEYVRHLIARSKKEAVTRNLPSPVVPQRKREPVQLVQPIASDARLDDVIIDDCPAVFAASPAPETFDVPLPPARTKPEETVDFSQLREAARLTATSALDAFECKGLVARGYSCIVIAVFGLLMSLILLTMSRHVDSLAFGACIGMLILAAAATYRHATISSELSRKARSRI